MTTLRRRIIALLEQERLGARDLSQMLRIGEKEVYDHLSHVQRSVNRQGKRLLVEAPVCLDCGYPFADRRKLTPPGSCPVCKGTHISDPRFHIG